MEQKPLFVRGLWHLFSPRQHHSHSFGHALQSSDFANHLTVFLPHIPRLSVVRESVSTWIFIPHFDFLTLLFQNFLLCLGNSRLTMLCQFQVNSTGTQPDMYMYPFSPTLLPSRLPHNTEQSPMCYTVGPCWLSILTIAVCTCPPQTP